MKDASEYTKDFLSLCQRSDECGNCLCKQCIASIRAAQDEAYAEGRRAGIKEAAKEARRLGLISASVSILVLA